MSYRIQVGPEAGTLLRTLRPHVLLQVGRALADVAESLAPEDEGGPNELRVDGCVLRFSVDHAQRLLRVERIEPGDAPYEAAEAPG